MFFVHIKLFDQFRGSPFRNKKVHAQYHRMSLALAIVNQKSTQSNRIVTKPEYFPQFAITIMIERGNENKKWNKWWRTLILKCTLDFLNAAMR